MVSPLTTRVCDIGAVMRSDDNRAPSRHIVIPPGFSPKNCAAVTSTAWVRVWVTSASSVGSLSGRPRRPRPRRANGVAARYFSSIPVRHGGGCSSRARRSGEKAQAPSVEQWLHKYKDCGVFITIERTRQDADRTHGAVRVFHKTRATAVTGFGVQAGYYHVAI
jgi:hypothetical protein